MVTRHDVAQIWWSNQPARQHGQHARQGDLTRSALTSAALSVQGYVQ